MEVYLVGGAVRDELLGIPVTERDWVVIGASPEDMEAKGYKAVGKDFPVFLHPQSKEEYALARTERKKGRGYKGFEVYTSPDITIEEDLLRRDLTINAIAQHETGVIIDPYGGQQDIVDKILRHVSGAFSEDPLRVLRVARFAAKLHSLGFKIEHETLILMRQIVSTRELRELSLERIWQETSKALLTDTPGEYFKVLEASNALAQVFPYFYYQFSDTDSNQLGLAALNTIAKQYGDPNIRFAGFVGGLYFNETKDEYINIKKLTDTFPLSNNCKKLLTLTVNMQHECHHSLQLDEHELLKLLHRLDTRRNPERFTTLLDVCEAIYISSNKRDTYKQKTWLRKAAAEIEKVSIDTWVREKVSGEKFANNIKQAQLALLHELIKNRD
ncbi:MAG: multifunctional CCA tRNA nucleotidyl transferase/2'3'-cyclic phosphodiesterase/2'nucleotidase/phosphatase [Gammaproteobacteria bacterium]|nr:MAG: multifunctional CCA tRNA nucleotidyl transferase/2'3'-cyclic phosphodiesterase/2'nucleotidase/phosphatase [Gammaproteobacteria bacterium]